MSCNKCGCNNGCKTDGKCSMAGKTCIDGLDKYLDEHNLEVCSTEWLAEHDKQIRAEAYAKGASDMEKAKQTIIDALLKQLNKTKSFLPMCDQYDDYDCTSSKDECFECMYQALNKISEQLKGAENDNSIT